VASGGTSVPPVQYVWSPVYVDALVLRDRDSNGDGTLDQRLYVMQDANYNITAIFDNAGTIVERYVYDPFGQVTVLATDWSERAASDFAWHYLHQGGRFDATSGLYHFRHRDYSPTLGRWTSLDPIRYEAGDVNLYRYVGNTPTVFTDPSGLDKFWLFDGKVKGPLYLLPGGENIWSDAWSLVFPKRSREYLKSPLHQNFNPDQTNRPGLKAGDIIDRDTRDWQNQAVQGLKSTLAEAGIQAGMAAGPMWVGAAAKGYPAIRMTPNGLGPDFAGTKYLKTDLAPGQKNIVKIKLQGSRYQDFKEANRLAGFKGAEPPKGYTWHHLPDYNPATGEATMQLVELKAHQATYPHKGSVFQYEQATGKKYK